MKFKVEIKEPCHESWENMHPSAKGRFCDMCSKEVVDFTGQSRQQITEAFQSKPTSVCGRFTKTQLERTYGAPPKYSLYSLAQKAAVLLGISLASPTIAQKTKTPTAIVERDKARVKHTMKEPLDTTKIVCSSDVKDEEKGFVEALLQKTEQGYQVTGKVIDNVGEPVVAATILKSRSKFGVLSDLDGTYMLELSKDEKLPVEITVSYVGAETITLSLEPKQQVIAEFPFTSLIEGMVIVGGAGAGRNRPRLHQRFLNLFRKKENHRW